MSATESISQKLFTALQAYVLSVDYAKRKVNPEEWETHIDWANLERGAKLAMDEYASGPHEEARRWVMQAVVLSTGHLSKGTFHTLRNCFDEEFPDVTNFNDGMVIYTGEGDELQEEIPDDAKACLKWAVKEGFSHVRFDPEGDVVSILPTYDW